MDRPYWEVENPQIVNAGKQIFKYYKQSGVLEICSPIEEDGQIKEVRRQTLSAYKLQQNTELADLVLDFMKNAGLVKPVEKVGK